jgi:hypothetical protein
MLIAIEIIPSRTQTRKDETKRSSMLDQNLYFQISLLRQEYLHTTMILINQCICSTYS